MRETWRTLRVEHPKLVADVADARQFIWLGSGISLGQVPGLARLISRVLTFLRDKAASGDPDAADHDAALRQILEEHLPKELPRYESSPSSWTPKQKRVDALSNRYAELLSVGVTGKPSDYLLIEGAGFADLYGDPRLVPGPTHVMIAILIFEGAFTKLASGNWDGLVEQALYSISGDDSLLDVYVDVDDVRDVPGNAEIAKFHGCAVRARKDLTRYRNKIVATSAQITSLYGDPNFAHMQHKLVELTTRHRSLLLGLSVQDADLQAVFRSSASQSTWAWEQDHPAFLFAEPTMRPTQRTVLQIAYGQSYEDERQLIESRSALGSYAGPVVAALAVEVLAAKYDAALTQHADLPTNVLEALHLGIRRLVVRVVAGFGTDEGTLSEFLLGGYADFMRTFFGTHNVGTTGYVPFVRGPRAQLQSQPSTVRLLGADRLALLIGVLGSGELERRWRVLLDDKSQASRISLTRRNALTRVTLIAVRSHREAIAVMGSHDWIHGSNEVVLLQMDGPHQASRRSPGGKIGKGRGARHRRSLDWTELSDTVTDYEDLLVRFETGVLI